MLQAHLYIRWQLKRRQRCLKVRAGEELRLRACRAPLHLAHEQPQAAPRLCREAVFGVHCRSAHGHAPQRALHAVVHMSRRDGQEV